MGELILQVINLLKAIVQYLTQLLDRQMSILFQQNGIGGNLQTINILLQQWDFQRGIFQLSFQNRKLFLLGTGKSQKGKRLVVYLRQFSVFLTDRLVRTLHLLNSLHNSFLSR